MKGAIKVIKQRKITTDIALPAAAVVVLLSVPLMATNSLHGYGQEVKTLRIGYFPNTNHAQAEIGLGKGDNRL
jgi:ABC-type nitrate/sulfonate/bicarbonate transport system substrate-binding protein